METKVSLGAVLDCKDPRLSMLSLPAKLEDAQTRQAIRVLSIGLSFMREGALAAISLGLPVQLLGIKRSEESFYILNPQIASLGKPELVPGEASIHTPSMRRDTLRARSMKLQGTGIDGKPLEVEVKDDLAIQAQQAMDFIYGLSPFGWMTPFHHLWYEQSLAKKGARFETVTNGLYRAGRDATKPAELKFVDPNRLSFGTEKQPDLGHIDALNPLLPTSDIDRAILALTIMTTTTRSLYLCDAGKLPVALAQLLMSPNAVVQMGEIDWPEAASRALGIAGNIQKHAGNFSELAKVESNLNSFAAVVIDRLGAPETPLPDLSEISALARLLDGKMGSLILRLKPEEEADVLQLLHKKFEGVYRFTHAKGEVFYLVRRSTMSLDVALARLEYWVQRYSMPEFRSALDGTWVHLRRDGKEQEL